MIGTMLIMHQYFKSIEQGANDFNTESKTQNTVKEEEKSSQQWKGALKELKIDTEKHHAMEDAGELTPDSMSSRLDSGVAGLDQPKDDLIFDRMASRVGTMAF